MRRLAHLLTACVLVALIGVGLAGCGGDDDCASDHDCEDTQDHQMVCEPDGCQRACSDDGDCPATDECVPRRVEEGRICEPTDQPLSNNS